MKRLSVDGWAMGIAESVAARSRGCRLQVGAVVMLGDRVLSLGYNGPPPGWPHCDESGGCAKVAGHCERTIHAESNALMRLPQVEFTGPLTLYCTAGVPCLRCCLLLAGRGVHRVVAPAHSYRDERALALGFTTQLELLRERGIEVVLLGGAE